MGILSALPILRSPLEEVSVRKAIIRTGLATLLACAGLSSFVTTVHAQDYTPYMDFAANNAAVANTFLNSEINRTMINAAPGGSPSSRNGTRASRTPPPLDTLPIQARVEVAALEALRPGLQRQWRTHGQQAAQRWYMASARKIGGEMGSLVREYRMRAMRDGGARADSWYLDRAREAGARIGAAD